MSMTYLSEENTTCIIEHCSIRDLIKNQSTLEDGAGTRDYP